MTDEPAPHEGGPAASGTPPPPAAPSVSTTPRISLPRGITPVHVTPPWTLPLRGRTGDNSLIERRAVWIARRARNVSRRPVLLGVLTACVFVVTLVALILIPHGAHRAARALMPAPGIRPDTTALAAALAGATTRLRGARGALSDARFAALAPPPPPQPVDTFPPALRARRDSLVAASTTLAALLRRTETAPLAASYRALGEAPTMRGQPRVRALLDSLAEVEGRREALGGAGSADPAYVSLTTRASEIGRAVEAIAVATRAELRRALVPLTPAVAVADTAPGMAVDTMPFLVARDSAAAALREVGLRLGAARAVHDSLDRREARARRLAAVTASPIAMLGAASVLGIALGFAIALIGEMRRPRIGDAIEAESVVGAPVLIRIETLDASPERARRRTDREVSPLIDLTSDRYGQLYHQLADRAGRLPRLAVVGDEPAVVATVTANLAAAAAHIARAAVVVDTDLDTHAVAGLLQVRSSPGLTDVLERRVDWRSATVAALVGRDRAVDVLSSGSTRDAAASL
ncbi:MAG: hypothetical protein WKG32_04200, partial [Gemmatimonadaceae bacterium]